jgi:2-oxoglutarate ferredoxin oxidoreductase subunit alpha
MSVPTAKSDGVVELDDVTIRFAGDAGDGMQLVGAQFTSASALCGNDVRTLPDFPAEIRAPAGALAGVSGFQVHFGRRPVHTPGDTLHALVAMNPAALRANLGDLERGGILVVNADAFVPDNLHKAGYAKNPLTDASLAGYRVFAVPMNSLNRDALAQMKLSLKEADRCRNFFALGLVSWLYERPLEPTLAWIRAKFAKNPAVLEANTRTLKAGYHYGETTNVLPVHYRVPAASIAPGKYRKITGNEALTLGLVAAAEVAKLSLVFAGFPMAPASDMLQRLAELREFDVRCVQTEDCAAAICIALGAAFGGALGATATSSPGLSLKSEAIGWGVMAELPCVIVNLQRAGPGIGMPTKTEQADLLQALYGRHGECPLPVLAPATPADCFSTVYEAVRLAIRAMTPVIVLADADLANGAEPWRIPDVATLAKFVIPRRPPAPAMNGFLPYARDERLARPWVAAGTPGLEHRVGGLEKEPGTGHVSFEPHNHEAMVRQRAEKIANLAADIPELAVNGPPTGDLLVVGWGSTLGAIEAAVARARQRGAAVANAHLRYLHPLPRNTGAVLTNYEKILVPELNSGQLQHLLRATLGVETVGLHKIQGRPFLVNEIARKIEEMIAR